MTLAADYAKAILDYSRVLGGDPVPEKTVLQLTQAIAKQSEELGGQRTALLALVAKSPDDTAVLKLTQAISKQSDELGGQRKALVAIADKRPDDKAGLALAQAVSQAVMEISAQSNILTALVKNGQALANNGHALAEAISIARDPGEEWVAEHEFNGAGDLVRTVFRRLK